MLILGYNCYVFDAAACLLQDGELVAASQQERFDRRKFSGAFPVDAIRDCLDQVGATIEDVDHVGFYWQPFHKFGRRLLQVASGLPGSLRWSTHGPIWWSMVRAEQELRAKFPTRNGRRARFEFHEVPHHVAHASSVFYPSPFERAAILTLDGAGELTSSAQGLGDGTRLTLHREIPFPHSMGYLYCALTDYLGFQADSDEYKVMALASYGGPSRHYERMKDVVRLTDDGGYRFDVSYFDFPYGGRDPWVSQRFIAEFGPRRRRGEPVEERHQAIAWAVQRRLEDVAMHAAHALHRETKADKLVVAGGCALNCVMNEKLRREGPFDDVWLQTCPNDAGTGLGAAWWIWHHELGHPRGPRFSNPYLGTGFDADACRSALTAEGVTAEKLTDDAVCEQVSAALADGAIVGWFQGRMELGPRALGHRSILADPRRADMKDVVNARVKHREGFRPFAPAITVEHVAEYFVDGRELPYMLFVLPVREEKRAVIPAVTHVDGTARVQTVSKAMDPLFHRLIERFGERTGVPVLLNTSLNDNGEPIVRTPQEAIRTARATGLDLLVLGPYVVTRAALEARPEAA